MNGSLYVWLIFFRSLPRECFVHGHAFGVPFAPTTAGRANPPMCDHKEMQIELELVRNRCVEVRLCLLPASNLGPPPPEASDPVNMRVDDKVLSFQTPAHDNKGRLGPNAFIRHELFHGFFVCSVEQVVEAPFFCRS